MTPNDARPEADEIGSPHSGQRVVVHHPTHEDQCWWCQKQRELATQRWAS